MKERNLFLLVFIILSICFLVSKVGVSDISSITGFATKLPEEVNVSVDKQVEDRLDKEDYVDVIIDLKKPKNKIKFLKEIEISNKQEDIINDVTKIRRRYKNIDTISATISKKDLENLKNNPNIEEISEVRKFDIALSDSVPLINADGVWSKQIDNINLTGKDETVCVLDTGVDYTHPALENKVVGQYCYCLPNCCHDATDEDTDAMDNHGHGTHVSGIVASNKTKLGVAPEANLVVVKVMDSGGGAYEDDIIAGIDWCVTNKNVYDISVITMSIGTKTYWSDMDCDSTFPGLSSSVNNAVDNNVIVFAASGNEAQSNGLSSPACLANVTSVGATTKSDSVASYSNSAPILDLLAPGSSITSTLLGGGYGSMDGTSMSAPHAAGAAVLLKQYANLQGYDLTPIEIKNTLKNTGKQIGGFPRIDVLKAIYSLDIVNPSVSLDSPVNKMYQTNLIDLNYTADDVNLDSVWYELNNVNTTLNGNTSLNLSIGNYNLKIYVNDSNGNINSDDVNFEIKASELSVNLDYPEDNYEDKDGNLTLNCSASDVYDLVNISLYTDLSGNFVLEESKDVSGLNAEVSFELSDVIDDTDFVWGCRAENNISDSLFSYNRTAKIRINDAPVFVGNIKNQTWDEDTNLILDLGDNFTDVDGDSLVYSASSVNNINVSFAGSVATLTPDADWWGNAQIKFNASDGLEIAESNLIDLTVNSMPDCGDSLIEGSEQCEDGDLNGETCVSLGYDKGTLACSSCMFDKSDCSNNSGGGTPSGGGGGDWSPAEETTTEVEETEGATASESVEEPVESGPEITGSAVKDVEKEGFFKVIWVKIKSLFWRVINFFRNIKFS